MLALFIRLLSRIACALPRSIALGAGSALAALLYAIYRLTPYRDKVYRHIQLALRLPIRQAHQLAQESIRRLVLSLVDFLRFPLMQDRIIPFGEVTIKGFHHVLQAQRRGKGVILASAHYGCWEMIPVTLAFYGIPVHVLVQKPSVKAYDALFRDFRARLGIQTHDNHTLQGLRPLLKALERGEAIGLVIDQHGESNQIVGRFFGHTVSLPAGPVFFARHCGSPIVPVLSRRTPENRHEITFCPPVAWPDTAKQEQAIQVMQGLYDWLETEIRAQPQDWLWVYNRWNKYRAGSL